MAYLMTQLGAQLGRASGWLSTEVFLEYGLVPPGRGQLAFC